ncbi:Aste57867_5621 [Aphanomyces stellatus]|uniref:Aste57867_5621 protein n=1 Tax=Aphanomyces stellatus TaxID=120398 RepID=A0A485KER0_9STRA|nr:hypothetical protein As57867_005608 [Aphanomyces stellatus]VFT82667.1 Aste57867_5621 [Aphanomyces stellatus]
MSNMSRRRCAKHMHRIKQARKDEVIRQSRCSARHALATRREKEWYDPTSHAITAMHCRLNLSSLDHAERLDTSDSVTANDDEQLLDDRANDSDSDDVNTNVHAVQPSSPAKSCTFPLASCRVMWCLWFHESGGYPPLRTIQHSSLSRTHKIRRTATQPFIRKLVAVAIKGGYAASEGALELLDKVDLEAMFDSVFAAFLNECGPLCTLTSDSPCTVASKWAAKLLPMSPKLPFPSVDCQTMWRLWYKGDTATSGIPYRRFANWESRSSDRSVAKRIMTHLAQIAVNESLVPSSLSFEANLEVMHEDAFMHAFDVVFPIFVRQFVPSAQAFVTPHKKCNRVAKFLGPRFWSEHPLAGSNPIIVSKKPPVVSCRQMWFLWFQGDDASNGVPYRRCINGSGCGMRRVSWLDAKYAMELVLKYAKKHQRLGSVGTLETMDTTTLAGVFDRTFPLLVNDIDPKYRRFVRPGKSCGTIMTYKRRSS